MLFKGRSLRLARLEDDLAELCFDREGESVNKLDSQTLAELNQAVDVLVATPSLRGLVITSAKDSFIVGADIFEFTGWFRKEAAEAAALVQANGAVFRRLETLPMPIVAAINGVALGGGFETALAADYRVMAAEAKIGLPEVTLGILPGYGGTVRLPRLVAASVALDWVTSGRPQDGKSALAAGAVDAVADLADLRRVALDHLKAATDWQARRGARSGPAKEDESAFAQARAAAEKSPVPARRAAVQLMQRTAALPRDEALKLEAETVGQLLKTQAAQALIQVFINDQAVKKKVKSYVKRSRPVGKGAVLGAGIMGGGIAYTSAVSGVPVIMKDIAQAALDLGTNEARKLLGKQVESGRLSEGKATEILGRIRPQLGFEGFGEVEVVVEAIVENLKIKKAVLAEVEGLVGPGTLLASNTSSLSITAMAEVLDRPQNFVGMHFFNPVPVMPLVEIVKGPRTAEDSALAVASYAAAMGKTPIIVKDCPGFLVNRIFTPYMIGFCRLVHDGADFLEIDRVMEGFGWPMGPAYLQDVIGMDTLAHVIEIIAAGFPDRMQVDFPHAPGLMAGQGRLGQKSGLGFYRYENDPKGRPRKLPAEDTHRLLAPSQPNGTNSFPDSEVIERMMLPMIIEAAHCLEEGIAESAPEIDMALILGLGFPRHVGGPLTYADWLGLDKVVARAEAFAALGPMYRPTAKMREMAATGARFFS